MITLFVRNVNVALWTGADYLRKHGVKEDSRNGPVLRASMPVTTTYLRPRERVMLHRARDANPFFHLYESLWMLAGRNDLPPLVAMVKNMANFSDDGGKTQPGAYGHRWRRHFGVRGKENIGIGIDTMSTWTPRDQLTWAVRRLREDPRDRRVVIQMYDANIDQDAADRGGRDVPCNLMACPTISTGHLELTVFCRSNDMVLGAYGANAVHFSVLAEFLAAAVGVPLGRYYQVSNNFHGYLDTMGKAGEEWPWGAGPPFPGAQDIHLKSDPYEAGQVFPAPMWQPNFNIREFDEDLAMFMEDPARIGIRSAFLRRVACPMVMAHRAYKKDGVEAALEVLQQMEPKNDWRAGAELWLQNRAAARAAGPLAPESSGGSSGPV